MLIVVVVMNTLIALLCFFVAWQIWKIRRVLRRISNTLAAVERSTHALLYNAPTAISRGEGGANLLRQRYQQLELQLQQVQKVLGLLSLGQVVWQQRLPLARRARFSKKVFSRPI
jgi:hypothetical protein